MWSVSSKRPAENPLNHKVSPKHRVYSQEELYPQAVPFSVHYQQGTTPRYPASVGARAQYAQAAPFSFSGSTRPKPMHSSHGVEYMSHPSAYEDTDMSHPSTYEDLDMSYKKARGSKMSPMLDYQAETPHPKVYSPEENYSYMMQLHRRAEELEPSSGPSHGVSHASAYEDAKMSYKESILRAQMLKVLDDRISYLGKLIRGHPAYDNARHRKMLKDLGEYRLDAAQGDLPDIREGRALISRVDRYVGTSTAHVYNVFATAGGRSSRAKSPHRRRL